MEFGLIGEKLGHSYSPQIHALLGDYGYILKELPKEEVGTFLRSGEFKGFNVTIPYKRDVIPYLDAISDVAKEIGSVNTVIKRPDGTLYGHNTDIGGFTHMVRSAGIDPTGRKVAILGSGGTSLTAQVAMRHMRAREIIVVSRSGPIDYETLVKDHADIEILVNTTPVGMYPKNGLSPIALEPFGELIGVVDVIYNPARTALILDAQERGIPCVSGLHMLVAQAREAAELFTGKSIDITIDKEIIAKLHVQMLNLILIGMPGCGKTTMGDLLSQRLERPLSDSDVEIVQRAGCSIPELFARDGEHAFRDLESQVLEDLCKQSGAVIATGGGVILREENVRAMRQNGILCLIKRDIHDLPRDGRPLSSSQEAVVHLWNARKEKYFAAADFIIENNASPEEAAKRIEEGFYEASHH